MCALKSFGFSAPEYPVVPFRAFFFSEHFGFLTSPHAIKTRSRCHPIFSRPLRSSTPVPHRHPTGSSSSLALFTWARESVVYWYSIQ